MLYRKIETRIIDWFKSGTDKVLIVEGARQIGKSFIIRKVGQELFPNFIEINLVEDKEQGADFEKVRSTEDFYLQVSSIAGASLGTPEDTLIFLDEIQAYPHLLTMLKFLRQEGRYRYVCSGSLLGLSLRQTTSVPIGSIDIMKMYPLDFEEFLIANGVGEPVMAAVRKSFETRTTLSAGLHTRLMDLFRKYLLVGGMPEAVNAYLATRNIVEVRNVQRAIHRLYEADASQYDLERKLKIINIYRMIPSLMDSKKKRVRMKDIENRAGSRYSMYEEEFDYLVDAGIALEVKAITGPRFPLIESSTKNLLKLYLNDVGLLTAILYHNDVRPVLDDRLSVNLGSVYESVIAQELTAHGYDLYYYDNKKYGEVDYLVNDYRTLAALPIEVKSGKDYKVHSALDRFLDNPDYNVPEGIVLCNSSEIRAEGKILYLPVYYILCLDADSAGSGGIFI